MKRWKSETVPELMLNTSSSTIACRLKARGVPKEKKKKQADDDKLRERKRDIGLMLMMEGAHPGRHLYLGLL